MRVRKRDGHEEQFEELRLIASLERALRAAGEHEAWARQFAETTALRCPQEGGVLETEVLSSTAAEIMLRYGCRDAAEAYRRRRRAEERARHALRVHGSGPSGTRSAHWDRARLQLALMRDRYLERAVARQVARRVERRLTAMGQRHLTARLVAAAADNECRVLGLASAPVGAERVGPERRQLRAWLGGDCLPAGALRDVPGLGAEGGDLRPALGEELLASFAVEELLDEGAREARARGRFEVVGLGDWLRPLALRLHPEPGEEEEAFWTRVAASAQGAREVQLLLPEGYAGESSRSLPPWLIRAGARLRLATRDLDLAEDWAAAGLWHALPVDCWAAADSARRTRLREASRTLLCWQPPRRLPAEGELHHGRLHGAAVLNLAGLAREAGPWGESDFLAAVGTTADTACTALRVLTRRACGGVRPRVALLPAGLPQALATLYPDPELAAARRRPLLLALRDLLSRAPARAELRADSGRPPHVADVSARLAERDGGEGPPAYPVGWLPAPAEAAALRCATAAAPWLELPADALPDGWAPILTPRAAARES